MVLRKLVSYMQEKETGHFSLFFLQTLSPVLLISVCIQGLSHPFWAFPSSHRQQDIVSRVLFRLLFLVYCTVTVISAGEAQGPMSNWICAQNCLYQTLESRLIH